MTKKKLQRFEENLTFGNLFQLSYFEVVNGFSMQGRWNDEYFRNTNPIVLELGCGKGEYTTRLAEIFPENNYIGIDIKGARLWKGCKTAVEQKMKNVAFIRTKIEHIEYLFSPDEVSSVWVTFPDPQPRGSRAHKRLVSPEFLARYRKILKDGAVVHLKTDNSPFYNYALEVAKYFDFQIIASSPDLYSQELKEEHYGIKTFYEEIFTKQGFPICYLKFLFSHKKFDEKSKR
ncbi:MAG: tRNA (guanosine(46)-N7)-methyltransferase TrmB [Bacteroidetes bacterium]|nr:tRNA (guanosine(46)-N7)-methyltransferase TrmB [Bacteroidota bacterium]MBU1720228.1 tRNA (guanosine(46)-N7)-methyltransferase TrmB [Bacteroidota bacterium]